MKKLAVIAVVALATLFTFSSCDRDKERCYKLTYKLENVITGVKVEITNYQWGTANEIDAQIANIEKIENTKVKKSIASKHKTMEDCLAANLKENK